MPPQSFPRRRPSRSALVESLELVIKDRVKPVSLSRVALLQEAAAKKGGNIIVLMRSFTMIKTQKGSDMMGDAEVYSCPE